MWVGMGGWVRDEGMGMGAGMGWVEWREGWAWGRFPSHSNHMSSIHTAPIQRMLSPR